MTRTHIKLVILLTLASLTSCHSNRKLQNKPLLNNWSLVKNWSFNGKMAINDGQNNGSGRISWSANDNKKVVKFIAPLGHGNWELKEDNNGAQLYSSIHETTWAENSEILINNELGWQLPWNKLSYWLRAQKSQSKLKPHKAPISQIKETGWTITFNKWIDTPIGFLPKKIKATKPPYTVKLIIYNWNIQPK